MEYQYHGYRKSCVSRLGLYVEYMKLTQTLCDDININYQ